MFLSRQTRKETQKQVGGASALSRIPLADNRVTKRGVVVLFEYNGGSDLTVHGLVSGKKYSFERPGSIVEVDERDRNLLLAMPSLRQL
jgi:hypothetical protein